MSREVLLKLEVDFRDVTLQLVGPLKTPLTTVFYILSEGPDFL